MLTLSFVATVVVCIDPVTAAQLTTALVELVNACMTTYLLTKQIEKV
jgi:hypothetical protein